MSQIKLNNKQMAAVKHKEGPMMVLAGPGSGKTMVITHRVKYLIEDYNVLPQKILVITFTKASAEEMKARFYQLMNKNKDLFYQRGNMAFFGTFHSIFFRIICSVYNYNLNNVLKQEKKYNILKKIVEELEIEYEDEQEFLNELQNEMSLMKNELIELKYYNPMVCSIDNYRKIVIAYEEYKKENVFIDFDDMLFKCYELLKKNENLSNYWQNKYKFVLVDEFQDINRVQYEITKMLVAKNKNLFVVGDDDQSIYRFRGARPEFLLDFPKDYPNTKTVILDINYRSNKNIVNSSSNVIKNNKKRYDKNIITLRGEGKKPVKLKFKDTEQEAIEIANTFIKLNKKGIPFYEMAVIFRTNIQARAIVDIFLDMNLPFILRDKAPSIYEHWTVKDITAYMKLAINKSEDDSLIRIINKPKRYISKWIINESKKQGIHLFKALYNNQDIKSWQITRIQELENNLKILSSKKPSEGIKYIRKIIGYDDYINEYAEFRKIGVKGLKEILDEIQESAKNFKTIEEWIEHIQQVSEEMKNIKKMKNVRDIELNKITLSTMHSAKGLEFDVVWIAGAVEGIIPHEKSMKQLDIEEERRLFYVGLTRAKEHLYISAIETRYEEEVAVSRFLNEMEMNFSNDDIKVGLEVKHKKYGRGIVKNIKNNTAYIEFDNKYAKIKKIDLDYCREHRLITIEN